MKALRQQQSQLIDKVRRVPLWPDFNVARSNTNTTFLPVTRIAFHVQKGVEFVDPLSVTHLEAQSNYTVIHQLSGRRIMISKTLKDIAKVFPQYFLRVHQTYHVNPQHIQTYLRHENELQLDSGLHLPVSRSGKLVMQEFVKRC